MILDSIFDNKIGIGPAQYIPLLFLSLIDLNDGAQLILSTFKPILHRLLPHSYRADWVAPYSKSGVYFGIYLLPGCFLRLNHHWQAVRPLWEKTYDNHWLNITNSYQRVIPIRRLLQLNVVCPTCIRIHVRVYNCNNNKCFCWNNT